jgi:hypothetical protein
MVILDICICIIVFLIGINLKNIFPGFSRKDKKFLQSLFIYHILISIAFHFYIVNNGGDAIHYWAYPKSASFNDILAITNQETASGVMYIINYFPSKVLDLSFFTGNIIYALIGYMGFVLFYRLASVIFPPESHIPDVKFLNIPIFPWIFFLPNLHFWSSGVGKDSLLFFSIALFVYSIQHVKKRSIGLIISTLISILIRPHITLLLITAFGISYVIDGRLKVYQKVFIFAFFIFGFISIFDYVLKFIQLDSFESSAIQEYAATKASLLNQHNTGSGIDISNYPYPLKVFTFLYRPLFFDANGILALISSFENILLLILTFAVFLKKPFSLIRKSNFLIKGMLIYVVIGVLAFSLILGNLGIMLRQKNMFIPIFIILGLWVIFSRRAKLKMERL